MWGVVYQGYNAVFPSFYPELFPTRTRVTAMAIAQNVGTTITALLPALFATVAPPGLDQHPADDRRDHVRRNHHRGGRGLERAGDLSDPPQRPRRSNAVPVAKPDYDQMRAGSLAGGARASA